MLGRSRCIYWHSISEVNESLSAAPGAHRRHWNCRREREVAFRKYILAQGQATDRSFTLFSGPMLLRQLLRRRRLISYDGAFHSDAGTWSYFQRTFQAVVFDRREMTKKTEE